MSSRVDARSFRPAPGRTGAVLAAARPATRAQREIAGRLLQEFRWEEALALLDEILASDPAEIDAGLWKGWAQAQLGRIDAALETTEALLERSSVDGRIWLNLGNWLKAAGRADASVAAYRRAMSLPNVQASAWWGLANVKAYRFTSDDRSRMERLLGTAGSDDARIKLHFALARAYEDQGAFDVAFHHLSSGSELRLAKSDGVPSLASQAANQATQISAGLFTRQGGGGFDEPGPIFIIGMPRAGTTLLERILGSHHQIEALGELPYVDHLTRELCSNRPYWEVFERLTPAQLHDLGRRYCALVRPHRHTDKPFFVDKMPSNWLHLALIRLALPNARIIDARRDPLDCCLSNFRQHFGRGHEFSYSLAELGRTYRAYVEFVGHFESVAGGRVARVIHEQLVAEPEPTLRRLLDEIDLEFDQSCLHFHESPAPVLTPSALQVRRPLTDEGIGYWKHYAKWLGPLVETLGPLAKPAPPAVESGA